MLILKQGEVSTSNMAKYNINTVKSTGLLKEDNLHSSMIGWNKTSEDGRVVTWWSMLQTKNSET